MHKLHKKWIIEWASQYIDDVTNLEIKGDVIRLSVGDVSQNENKLVGIITYQKI